MKKYLLGFLFALGCYAPSLQEALMPDELSLGYAHTLMNLDTSTQFPAGIPGLSELPGLAIEEELRGSTIMVGLTWYLGSRKSQSEEIQRAILGEMKRLRMLAEFNRREFHRLKELPKRD